MFSEFQVDTSELKRLRGISIGKTENDQPFLVLTYDKGKLSERVFALVCWLVVAVLYGLADSSFGGTWRDESSYEGENRVRHGSRFLLRPPLTKSFSKLMSSHLRPANSP
jgi:hypothetical protein